ncbi:hypothetical protein CAPTEDRAFT_208135, partial [Capitella teleta]
PVVDKEKEQARIARAIERREAREQAKAEKQKAEALRQAEEKRKAEEKARLEKEKAEERRLAEEKRKAEEKAKREKQKAEELKLAEEKRIAEEKAKAEKQKAEALRLAEEKRKAEEKAKQDKAKAEQQKAEALKLAEEKRIAEEKAKAEKQKAEALRLAEEKRKAEDKAKAEQQKVEELRLAEEKRIAEEKARDQKAKAEKEKTEALAQEQKRKEEERLLAEKQQEEAARIAKEDAEKAEQIKQAADSILPSRPIAYQIASQEDPRIMNFDQAITRRFKVSGSYLDKGEQGNNIIKDNRGREFLNVIAFWDVLVEPQSNGENHYYGSIQFPLGSRHPAIIKSTVPEDEISLGCQASEVVVLKSFETEGVDYTHGLVDAYLAHSVVMPDGTVAFQEVVRQPSFSLINVETGCMPRDMFSCSHVDPERMGHDKTLYALPAVAGAGLGMDPGTEWATPCGSSNRTLQYLQILINASHRITGLKALVRYQCNVFTDSDFER